MKKLIVYEIYENGRYSGFFLESELSKVQAYADLVAAKEGVKVEIVKAERYSEI